MVAPPWNWSKTLPASARSDSGTDPIRNAGIRGEVVDRKRSTSSSDRRSSKPSGPAPRRSSGALAQWSRTNAAGSPAQRSIAGLLLVGAVGIVAAVAVGPVGVAAAVAVGPVGAVTVLRVGHGGRRRRAGALGVLTPGGDDVLVLDTRGVGHGRPPRGFGCWEGYASTPGPAADRRAQVRAATT